MDRTLIPAVQWLRGYENKWLRADLIAGVTLAACLIPAGLADASLANLPPQAGLYACLSSARSFPWCNFCAARRSRTSHSSDASPGGGDSPTWRHSDNEPIPGALLFRTEASLHYFNADYARETVMKRVREMDGSLCLAICDLSSPYVDLAGAEMLTGLHRELSAANVRLQIVKARSAVPDRLHAVAVETRVGSIDRHTSVADAVDEFLRSDPAHERTG